MDEPSIYEDERWIAVQIDIATAHIRRLLLEENVCRPGMVTATVQRLLPEIERRIRLEAARAAAEASGVKVH